MDLTEVEKAAVLLIALGPQRAQSILDRLSSDEMLAIIAAMKRMGQVPGDVRRAVLEEVNRILMDRAARCVPNAREPSDQPESPPLDLLSRLGPYLPERIDPGQIDWNAAGFDFDPSSDDPSRRCPPPEEGP